MTFAMQYESVNGRNPIDFVASVSEIDAKVWLYGESSWKPNICAINKRKYDMPSNFQKRVFQYFNYIARIRSQKDSFKWSN